MGAALGRRKRSRISLSGLTREEAIVKLAERLAETERECRKLRRLGIKPSCTLAQRRKNTYTLLLRYT
jgi:hypothetical protein